MAAARAYEVNGEAADAARFTRVACDPAHSVVVEACAGSGKTWLLVARMLRLLLAGTAPSELLAITFTRKAAQEMRERLVRLLHELALTPDEQALTLLRERGVPPSEAPQLLPGARGLYERVLSSPQSLSIDTFHSWFARLLQIAPLASGVPHGYSLTEATGELLLDAYSRLMQALNEEQNEPVRAALFRLYELLGDRNTRRLLDAFVSKRAEWWAALRAGEDAPMEWLRELCAEDAYGDARLGLWQDEALLARIRTIARLLGQGTAVNQKRATAIETALNAGASIVAFDALCDEFMDGKGDARRNNKTKALVAALEKHFDGDAAAAFDTECEALAEALRRMRKRSCEPQVIETNACLFAVGTAFVEQYQQVKAEQRVFDFSDLEWHAYRLLSNEEHAAYLQSRLDARYKHILLDEFQDTNPLQWSIVRAWLGAYGGDAQQPSVFVVGDPKQSIYRFRRAEPRVFTAARDMLAAQGAAVLRTNQTRRNAGGIIAALNASFIGNPIFSPQTTLASSEGSVWRLPLVREPDREAGRTQEAEEMEGGEEERAFFLRDPLASPLEEREDARRLDEGRALAHALIGAREKLDCPWSEVMLLVRKRTHLSAYEAALRDAGIPFVSDKRGGLLESLEVADLIALLNFLMTPGDNRALAHVLKSPLFGAGDDDLIRLATYSEGNWWKRLQASAEDGSPEIRRAARLLHQWLEAAPRQPVHDLLDLILHQGDVVARYASAAQPAVRAQVLGNIEAFTELALNLDAGRYPSLTKFIEALRLLRQGAEADAPDEAAVDAAVDAVRILTIHSAKGLEARIVALVDANQGEGARDDCGILCDWPQDADAPTHFSCFGRKDERGMAREHLFEAEERFRQQEDWNLLYVAVTRAKSLLILSGVAGTRAALPDGVIEGSWYHRFQAAIPETIVEKRESREHAAAAAEFSIPIFNPPLLEDEGAAEPELALARSRAIDEGVALHALLEKITYRPAWPVSVPDAQCLTRWLSCPPAMAPVIRERALAILSQPELERFFNPAHFLFACNELEVVHGEAVLRFDRAVIFENEVWILDYKRGFLDSERSAYQGQLARYREAARQVFPGKAVRTALITSDGTLWEMG